MATSGFKGAAARIAAVTSRRAAVMSQRPNRQASSANGTAVQRAANSANTLQSGRSPERSTGSQAAKRLK